VPTAPLLRRLALAPLAVLAVAVPAACGSSDDVADPAAIVPARAPAYLEATIAPEGQQREDALAAGRKVLATDDPEAKLRELLRARTGKGDVEPWLGDKVAAFAAPGAKGRDDGAVIASTSDAGAAQSWIDDQGGRTQEHEGVEIRVASDEKAYALVKDQVVAGSLTAVKAAIDASEGDSLAESEGFEKAFDRVGGEEGIGRAYLAPRALSEAGGAANLPQAGGMLGSLATGALTSSLPTAVAAKFHADGEALRADVASVGGAEPGDPADPEMLAGLTGKAWLAAGVGEVGARLRQQLESLGASEAMLGLLSAQAGLDVRRDLIDWMGEGAVFVLGDDASSLGGALVVKSKDSAATRAAIPKIGSLIGRVANGVETKPLRAAGVDEGITLQPPGAPTGIHIAAAGDLFVVAAGDEALQEAISPSSRLGDDADFQAAAATLGDDLDPTTYVGVGRLGALAGAVGQGSAELQATLERFTALVAADRGEGRWRAALGLR
jgi:hypothetical protein